MHEHVALSTTTLANDAPSWRRPAMLLSVKTQGGPAAVAAGLPFWRKGRKRGLLWRHLRSARTLADEIWRTADILRGLDVDRIDAIGELAEKAVRYQEAQLAELIQNAAEDFNEQRGPLRAARADSTPYVTLLVGDRLQSLFLGSDFDQLVTVVHATGSGKTRAFLADLVVEARAQQHRKDWKDRFVGAALGLSRFERRHLRALLLGMVERLGRSLRGRRDRLNAQECRSRVHLRTPLQGALTRTAPPVEPPVRLLQVKAGCLARPPMLLAA
ncbi:hypothetical protein ABT104_00435 [Streptomyces mobaraensis]|uniref:hypothetical protein n=1 Tax=Streptomyces mobaraensis TaxID=35621 RepID=UPI0033256E68